MHIEYVSIHDAPQTFRLEMDGQVCFRIRVLRPPDPLLGETFVAELPAYWCRPYAGGYGCEWEMIVLKGELRIGETAYPAGSYVHCKPGAVFPGWRTDVPTELLIMGHEPMAFRPDTLTEDWAHAFRSIFIPDCPWQSPPGFEGRSTEQTIAGISLIELKPGDPNTSYTYLVRNDPGWADPRLESHNVWEELLLISGDYLMGHTGSVGAGTYIFRPALVPHGPQATRDGVIWLARGQKTIDFILEEIPWANEAINNYLKDDNALPQRKVVAWL